MGSRFYDHKDISDGIVLLERAILDLIVIQKDCSVISCGDLNARTGVKNTYFGADIMDVTTVILDESRQSQDNVINSFGRYLLSLCSGLDFGILNGCTPGNSDKYTYMSVHGNSLVDYFIVSKEPREFCESVIVKEKVISSQMPIEAGSYNVADNGIEQVTKSRFKWTDEGTPIYIRDVSSYLESEAVVSCFDKEQLDINEATSCIQSVSIVSYSYVVKQKTGKCKWFDKQCFLEKKNWESFWYFSSVSDNINSSLRDSTIFWNLLRGMNRTGRSRFCNISFNDWFNHFPASFETRFQNERGDRDNTNPLLNDILKNITPQKEACELNSPITEQEIKQSIKQLKNNKAAGADGVVSEMFKFAGSCLIPYIHSLFNRIFDTGVYPVLWSNSTIIPIYKKGSVNVTDNYRGICLSSIFSKKFTRILNVRLEKSEEQAGFRRGYSTIDNAFILNSFVQKYRRKVYVAFIDYRKAFDSVNRSVVKSYVKMV